MKRLLLLFLLITSLAVGQTITTPNSQNIPIGVNGLPINGFNLSGYNSTTTYKVSLSITGNSGGTFSVTSTSGLTRDYGYNSWTNITAVNFTGTPTNIQNGLNSIKLNTTSTIDGLINLSVVIASQQTNTYYNPDNGHMYKFVPGYISVYNARNNAKASTFEGEPGYLVNITSAAEQTFINQKVQASNVWIGLTDDGHEGVWKWMDGPEAGQTSTYYNWCGSEPNNWGSGEDYVVTKWYGDTCWNDFGPPATTSTFSIGGYIIEYGTWTNPTQSTFNSTQNVQITFTQKDMLWVDYKFNFGNGINPTDYSGMMYYEESANTWNTNNTQTLTLNSTGNVNTTSQIQETSIGKKATTTGGQVEWGVLYKHDATYNRHILLIDRRELPTGISAEDITQLQLFDLWDGEVTYNPTASTTWAYFYIYTNTPLGTSNSNYSSYIRDAGNYFGLKAEFSFTDIQGYKPQSFIFQSPTQATIETMIDDIVTVTDAVLAFNELSNGGIDGGLAGNLNGIQLQNADIDGNNQFDYDDTYLLLQHLNGVPFVQSTETLVYFMKIKETNLYNSITPQNWQSQFNATTLMAPIEINPNSLVTFPNFSVTWKGDVDLSHSPTQNLQLQATKMNRLLLNKSVEPNITEVHLDIEKQNNNIVVSILLPTNIKNITGAQFRVMFDNTRLTFDKIEYSNQQITNFNSQRTNYINLGSISTDGSQNLNGGIEYKVYFKTNQDFESILGLVSVQKAELVSQEGIQIERIIK